MHSDYLQTLTKQVAAQQKAAQEILAQQANQSPWASVAAQTAQTCAPGAPVPALLHVVLNEMQRLIEKAHAVNAELSSFRQNVMGIYDPPTGCGSKQCRDAPPSIMETLSDLVSDLGDALEGALRQSADIRRLG